MSGCHNTETCPLLTVSAVGIEPEAFQARMLTTRPPFRRSQIRSRSMSLTIWTGNKSFARFLGKHKATNPRAGFEHAIRISEQLPLEVASLRTVAQQFRSQPRRLCCARRQAKKLRVLGHRVSGPGEHPTRLGHRLTTDLNKPYH